MKFTCIYLTQNERFQNLVHLFWLVHEFSYLTNKQWERNWNISLWPQKSYQRYRSIAEFWVWETTEQEVIVNFLKIMLMISEENLSQLERTYIVQGNGESWLMYIIVSHIHVSCYICQQVIMYLILLPRNKSTLTSVIRIWSSTVWTVLRHQCPKTYITTTAAAKYGHSTE